MSTLDAAYVAAYRNVLLAVYDCTKFVSRTLGAQIASLEAQIDDDARIEALREIARG